MVTNASILTINTGSSSLKAALYPRVGGEQPILTALASRIGLESGRLIANDAGGRKLVQTERPLADHRTALEALVEWLHGAGLAGPIAAVGHRLVHGGARYASPVWIDGPVLDDLRSFIPLAPNHLPQAIAAVESLQRLLPGRPQLACFDTAFHRTLPRVAQLLPLPRQLADQGVVRYGFHGLSYEYLVDQLQNLEPEKARGRLILAHLGHGASMAAVREGMCIDTTMGFTPAGGLPMSTRSGDLDPGVLVYLLQQKQWKPEQLNQCIYHQAGMIGLSGGLSDMRDLLDAQGNDPRAAEAVEVFCYQCRKQIGAYVAALSGLDVLVFSGGIGENAAELRRRICAGLDHLGIRIAIEKNERQADCISTADSPVIIRVIKTNEDLMIARHARRLLGGEGSEQASAAAMRQGSDR
jgi:acetate kinase